MGKKLTVRKPGLIAGKCSEWVYSEGRDVWGHQCSRKAVKDGYCLQHHPDSVAERRAKRDAGASWEHALFAKECAVSEVGQQLLDHCDRGTVSYASLPRPIREAVDAARKAREKVDDLRNDA